jgi:tyrosyl-tRNA synthetase
MVASTSEAARLIKQGGVKIDSKKVEDPKLEIKKGSEAIYQVGKRKFLKIKV